MKIKFELSLCIPDIDLEITYQKCGRGGPGLLYVSDKYRIDETGARMSRC